MAALPNLITAAEADAILAPPTFADWVGQPPQTKEFHINQASTYVRTRWSCSDEDFDTPTLSDDAKRGVAYYAEASRAGNLFDSVSDSTSAQDDRLTERTLTAGSLTKSESWSDGSSSTVMLDKARPLSMADAVFDMIGCSALRSGSVIKLVRD